MHNNEIGTLANDSKSGTWMPFILVSCLTTAVLATAILALVRQAA